MMEADGMQSATLAEGAAHKDRIDLQLLKWPQAMPPPPPHSQEESSYLNPQGQ